MSAVQVRYKMVDLGVRWVPSGASFELSLPFDAAYSLTGKTVRFRARQNRANPSTLFEATDAGDDISIVDQTAILEISEMTANELSGGTATLAAAMATLDLEKVEFGVDVLPTGAELIDWRFQGELIFEQPMGRFTGAGRNP